MNPNLESSIAWLDFSDEDRRKMIEVISLFRTQETRDELGIGVIRDSLAESFFPGTTTLQTRARYFLFVPWLYLEYARLKVPSGEVQTRLKNDEIRIIRSLQDAGETDGVIGRISGASLGRFPSSIYWNGLRSWGILNYQGELHQLNRGFERLTGSSATVQRSDDGEIVSGRRQVVWDAHIPPKPDRFPYEASFALTKDEALFLRDRLMMAQPGSLMAFLADRGQPTDDVDFVWAHPQRGEVPAPMSGWLEHAQNFSEAMLGAALLYNEMLSELVGNEEWVSTYRDDLALWRKTVKQRASAFRVWDRNAFWALVFRNGRIPSLTMAFVDEWLEAVLEGPSPPDIVRHKGSRQMIKLREHRLKRGRSRFYSQRHRELWSGAAGAGQMDFRWRVASRILNDIQHGLGR